MSFIDMVHHSFFPLCTICHECPLSCFLNGPIFTLRDRIENLCDRGPSILELKPSKVEVELCFNGHSCCPRHAHEVSTRSTPLTSQRPDQRTYKPCEVPR